MEHDTIVAQATPPGVGGVGIVRISGPLAVYVAKNILNKTIPARQAVFCDFRDRQGELIDQGIAIYFSKPNSFTGEDVLELHGHGGSLIMDILIANILALGARLAKPGEFSERAFLNNKLDLVQAEAIADIINATNVSAAKCSARSLRGEFSQKIDGLVAQVMDLRVQIEGRIDFSEEEDFHANYCLTDKSELKKIFCEISELCDAAERGTKLNREIKVVIVGEPNVGKSTLFNRLTEEENAIVTDIPGTTRDVLKETIVLNGMLIKLCDTAGFRDNPDRIETEGIKRARKELADADHILWVVDTSKQVEEKYMESILNSQKAKVITVYNKIDLIDEEGKIANYADNSKIYISAKNGSGIELLRKHLINRCKLNNITDGFSARKRHVINLQEAKNLLLEAINASTIECIAESLVRVQSVLQEIIGKVVDEDVLHRIFSDFCIGK